ncbi:TraX protein [Oscillospiraceae bacterium]|nr:TraX protein [Oscillospiraceae bacterium]
MFHYFLKDDKKKRWICLSVSYLAFFALAFAGKGITALGLLLVPVILLFVYNGQGGRKSTFIFYPAHLIILSVIKWFII